jgi:hypothetical protein
MTRWWVHIHTQGYRFFKYLRLLKLTGDLMDFQFWGLRSCPRVIWCGWGITHDLSLSSHHPRPCPLPTSYVSSSLAPPLPRHHLDLMLGTTDLTMGEQFQCPEPRIRLRASCSDVGRRGSSHQQLHSYDEHDSFFVLMFARKTQKRKKSH